MVNEKAENIIGQLFRKPKNRLIIIITGSFLIILGLFGFSYNYYYRDKIFPKTYIGGINVGGLTLAEAETLLAEKEGENQKNSLELNFEDKKWTINTSDIDFKILTKESAEHAFDTGHLGNFFTILKEQLKSLLLGNRKLAIFTISQSSLNSKITTIQREINLPEKDATIVVQDLQPQIRTEAKGRSLDFSAAHEQIINALGNFTNQSNITLSVREISPKVTAKDAEGALQKTQTILSQSPLTIKSPKANFTLKTQDYASWLRFAATPVKASSAKINLTEKSPQDNEWIVEVELAPEEIQQYLRSIAGQINQNAQDAKFQVQNGQVTAFQTSNDGYKLDEDKALPLLSEAIMNNSQTLDLPVQVIKPEVTSQGADALGLKEMVSQGQTSWRGSPQNRIHNLSLGASKISGNIIKPGEEFSTVSAIGPIDQAHGFLPELVIKNSTQVVPEDGGGLCQVSTTLFRAVLNAGLKITARTPHSFRVSYYEPPVGMDATIYDPAPDFKFVNTYSTPLLIWAIAGNNSLTFQIYGTKDGRQITISDPVVGSYIDPPGDVYSESATMAPGTVRQVERALRGATASFHYHVADSTGKTTEDQTFVSKYVALPNSYLYGPGWTPPSE